MFELLATTYRNTANSAPVVTTTSTSTMSMSNEAAIWIVISSVIAIIGGILAYCLFVMRKNDGKFKGFWGWLHAFLGFDKMMLEMVVKVLYLISAIFVTLASFAFISQSFLIFLAILVFGNIFMRLGFEFTMMSIALWKNTTVIKDRIEKIEDYKVESKKIKKSAK